MPIINSVLAGGGGTPVSADTTMSLPIDVETSGNNISMFGGSYASTLNASTTGQTKGYKNDAYIVLNQDDTKSMVLSQTETFPSGSFKSAVMSSTSVYLDDTKTNVIGTTTPTGFEVSYNPTEEGVIKPNYSVVGSVTVDSNNVASGFSSSNYLVMGYFLDISQDFEIGCKCKITSSEGGYRPVFGSLPQPQIFLGRDDSNHPHFNLCNSGGSWGSGPHISDFNMVNDGIYYLKGVRSGSTITVYASTDGENWSSASSTFNTASKVFCPLIGKEDNGNPFNGNIYLEDCYVKVGGVVVYQPNPSAVYPKENFTRVGSPTITDGILGNLTYSNYLEFPGVNIGAADRWEIFTKVKTGSAVNSSYYILGGGGKSCFDYGIAGDVWKFYLSSDGSGWNLASNISKNINASTSTWYYVKFYFTGTKYEMDVSTDGETWTNVADYESTTKVYDCPTMRVGNTNDKNWPWKDYIDLNETYIKVNDKIVWRPIVQPSAGDITVGEGYGYIDENNPPFLLDSDLTQTASQMVVHSEDFAEETEYNSCFITKNSPVIDTNHWVYCGNKGLVADRQVDNTYSTFEIGLKIGGCNNTSPNQIMFASTYGNYTAIAINIANGKFALYLSSNASSSYDIANGTSGSYSVQTLTTYYLKLIFDGSKYVLSYSLDGENYIDDITVTSSTKIPSFTPTVCSWVQNGTSVEISYNGFIDLDNVYVKTDGNLVWSPYMPKAVKKGTLFLTKPTSSTTSDAVCANSTQSAVVQKYTTTGSSVVVDSNHRASGFTTTDYIKIPLNAWMAQYSVETVIHFKTPETFGSDYPQGLGIDDSYDWRVGVSSNGVFCGSAGSWGSMSYSMQPNTEYWLKILSPSKDVYISTDGENYTRIGGNGFEFNNNQVMQNFCLGKMYNDSQAFGGTIYLDDCYIKLDGVIASAPFMTESVSVSPTPTGTYAGSVVTPLNMSKTVTMDTTLTKLIEVS